jgi:hypothetical protein
MEQSAGRSNKVWENTVAMIGGLTVAEGTTTPSSLWPTLGGIPSAFFPCLLSDVFEFVMDDHSSTPLPLAPGSLRPYSSKVTADPFHKAILYVQKWLSGLKVAEDCLRLESKIHSSMHSSDVGMNTNPADNQVLLKRQLIVLQTNWYVFFFFYYDWIMFTHTHCFFVFISFLLCLLFPCEFAVRHGQRLNRCLRPRVFHLDHPLILPVTYSVTLCGLTHHLTQKSSLGTRCMHGCSCERPFFSRRMKWRIPNFLTC